jgi:hypothetical protein
MRKHISINQGWQGQMGGVCVWWGVHVSLWGAVDVDSVIHGPNIALR